MEFVASWIYGGPEARALVPPGLKHRLPAALAPLMVDGLTELDLSIRIGGSVTPAEGDGGVHAVRRSASTGRVTANLVIPASEIAALGANAVLARFEELAALVGARLDSAGLDGEVTRDELTRSFRAVFTEGA